MNKIEIWENEIKKLDFEIKEKQEKLKKLLLQRRNFKKYIIQYEKRKESVLKNLTYE